MQAVGRAGQAFGVVLDDVDERQLTPRYVVLQSLRYKLVWKKREEREERREEQEHSLASWRSPMSGLVTNLQQVHAQRLVQAAQ